MANLIPGNGHGWRIALTTIPHNSSFRLRNIHFEAAGVLRRFYAPFGGLAREKGRASTLRNLSWHFRKLKA